LPADVLVSRGRTSLKSASKRRRYDVVVVGGGAHGLATAYYLARDHGVRDVAVLERSYIGSGGSGRNTTTLRANYKTPETIAFYRRSLELYHDLSAELEYSTLISTRGLLWLAHSRSQMRLQRERAELNQLLGVDTSFVEPEDVARLCPVLDMTGGGHHPILGASWHPPGAIIRHDAVVWGYAAAAQRLGVAVHQGTPVSRIVVERGRCTGVETDAGRVEAGAVVLALGGYVSPLATTAGVRLPITTHPLQAFVTEAYEPLLDRIITSADLLVYVSQTSRGEMLVGAEIERYPSRSTRSTAHFLSSTAARCIDLIPAMARMRVRRAWTGLCDMTPDYTPIMGSSGVEHLYLTTGWGTWGFKAVPASGKALAATVATGTTPDLIAPFGLDRFESGRLIAERSSAGTH
jgi:sarcosine oxidase subunit beta